MVVFQNFEIVSHCILEVLPIKSRCWMVEWHDFDHPVSRLRLQYFAVQFSNLLIFLFQIVILQKENHGNPSQRSDYSRLDYIYLAD